MGHPAQCPSAHLANWLMRKSSSSFGRPAGSNSSRYWLFKLLQMSIWWNVMIWNSSIYIHAQVSRAKYWRSNTKYHLQVFKPQVSSSLCRPRTVGPMNPPAVRARPSTYISMAGNHHWGLKGTNKTSREEGHNLVIIAGICLSLEICDPQKHVSKKWGETTNCEGIGRFPGEDGQCTIG